MVVDLRIYEYLLVGINQIITLVCIVDTNCHQPKTDGFMFKRTKMDKILWTTHIKLHGPMFRTSPGGVTLW